jgi:hypothetical protein
MTTTTFVALTFLLILTGCTDGDHAVAGPSARPTAKATTTPSTPTPKPTPTVIGMSIARTCSDLVPDSTLTSYGGTFKPVSHYKPKLGTRAASLYADRGIACAWKDAYTQDHLILAVAHLPIDNLEMIKNNLVMRSNSVPTYGVEGYFQRSGSSGEAEVFRGPYWIYAMSETFKEPGDAERLVDSVLASLP